MSLMHVKLNSTFLFPPSRLHCPLNRPKKTYSLPQEPSPSICHWLSCPEKVPCLANRNDGELSPVGASFGRDACLYSKIMWRYCAADSCSVGPVWAILYCCCWMSALWIRSSCCHIHHIPAFFQPVPLVTLLGLWCEWNKTPTTLHLVFYEYKNLAGERVMEVYERASSATSMLESLMPSVQWRPVWNVSIEWEWLWFEHSWAQWADCKRCHCCVWNGLLSGMLMGKSSRWKLQK